MADGGGSISDTDYDQPLSRSDAARINRISAAVRLGLLTGCWPEVGEYLATNTSRLECAELALAAIDACEERDAIQILDGVLRHLMAGPPLPKCDWESWREAATHWAAMATEPERKHWMLACFMSLSKIDRVKALSAMQRRATE